MGTHGYLSPSQGKFLAPPLVETHPDLFHDELVHLSGIQEGFVGKLPICLQLERKKKNIGACHTQ